MTKDRMTFAAGWSPMLEEYFRLKRQQTAILAWQMGDWFEFYFEDAKVVASFLGIALSARGKRPNGVPIAMCAVPEDTRFSVVDDRLLVPLAPNGP